MRSLFLVIAFSCAAFAKLVDTDITPHRGGEAFGKIRFLDQKELIFPTIDGIRFSEISDLAYHQQTQILYFLSDAGNLFTFRARFGGKITLLEPKSAHALVKRNGAPFLAWRRDSEGMDLDRHGTCYISFEGRAKIGRFDQKGRMQKQYRLPLELRDPKNYRSRNKSLEALTWHPRYGLLTAAEWPLKRYAKKYQTIYSLRGKRWHFRAEEESKSAVVAMEVMDDGNLLVLERSFIDLFHPLVITLKKVYLSRRRDQQGHCQSEVLLKMNSHHGWSVDNFEGLAKVGRNRYVMVSDDNDNFFQKTLLIYFEIRH